MATSAQKQVAQSNNKVERATMVATGKSAAGSITFDTMPKAIKLPRQMVIVINAYYDLIDERGGTHQLVTIEELNQVCEEQFAGYSQDAATIIAHYKQQIEGSKAWKHNQGKIQIGQFK